MISHFQNNLIARPYFSQEIFILDLQAWNTGEPGILLVSTIRIVRLVMILPWALLTDRTQLAKEWVSAYLQKVKMP